MAEETMNKGTSDGGCGLFNFMGKKEEDRGHHNDTVNVEEKQSLMEALHRTHSNSSSSSDDEEVEEGSTREKKKKKGLKEKMKEKISGDHDQQKSEFIPMDNCPAPHEED